MYDWYGPMIYLPQDTANDGIIAVDLSLGKGWNRSSGMAVLLYVV